jgi:hypothetical protein
MGAAQSQPGFLRWFLGLEGRSKPRSSPRAQPQTEGCLMGNVVVPFRRRAESKKACRQCRIPFEPLLAEHQLCRCCWNWQSAGLQLARAIRSLREAQR